MLDAKVEILSNEEVAADFYLARLRAPHIADTAQPGQFVEVQTSQNTAPFLRLPLSICGVDRQAGTADILFEDMGPKTRALSLIEPGREVACLGPLGKGFTAPAAGQQVVLVGGGIGIPPLLFLGEGLRRVGHSVSLLVGARVGTKHLPLPMLQAAAEVVRQATDDGSVGHYGLVTDLLEEELAADASVAVYTCGPHGMMAAVTAVCGREQVACQASLEEYMACGFGVCVGCVVEVEPETGEETSPYLQYSRICVDGPVFDAHRVKWE